MAFGSTQAGRAHVDVDVDGSGINEGIVDAVEESLDDVGDVGKRAGRRYAERFSPAFLRRVRNKLKGLDEAVSPEMSSAGEESGKDFAEGMEKSLSGRMRDVADRASKSLRDRLESREDSVRKGISGTFDDDFADRMGQRFADRFLDGLEDRIRTGRMDFRRALDPMKEHIASEAGEVGSVAGIHMADEWIISLKERLLRTDDHVKDLMEQINKENSKARPRDLRLQSLIHALRSAQNEAALLDRQLRTLMKSREKSLFSYPSSTGGSTKSKKKTPDGDGPDLGDRMGQMFGAGSRNDGINAVGRSITGLIRLAQTGQKALTGIFKIASAGTKAFRAGYAAVEAGGTLAKVGGGFTSMFSKAGASLMSMSAILPVVAVAVTSLIFALTTLVSVVGALAAILTAMVATVMTALVGILIVTGGLLIAVTAAAGLAAAAFLNLSEAQKKALSADFKPVKDSLVEIGRAVAGPLSASFSTWAANVQAALNLVKPIADDVGQALGEGGSLFTKALSGEGFQKLFAALGNELPAIITNLSNAFGQFLNGIAGMFAPIMPYITMFTDHLSKAATKFAEWASSAKGQNSIKDFMDRASVSVKALWGFIKSVGGLLADIFFSEDTQKSGDTIFDRLKDTFEDLRDKFEKAEKSGKLKKWLDDGIKFGEDLKDTIDSLSDTWTAFYNSGAVEGVGDALEVLSGVLETLNPLFQTMSNFLGWIIPPTAAVFTTFVNNMTAATNGLVDALGWLWDKLAGLGSALKNAVTGGGGGSKKSSGDKKDYPYGPPPARGEGGGIPKKNFNDSGDRMVSAAMQAGAASVSAAQINGDGPVAATAKKAEKEGKGLRKVLRRLMKTLRKELKEILSATDPEAVRQGLTNMRRELRAQVQKGGAAGARAARALKKLDGQGKVDNDRVGRLVKGLKSQNATLADYAKARGIVAKKLEAANEKLADAIAMRDDYRDSVIGSVKSFNAIITTEAQVIDGVTQALTSKDITSNLRDRLAKTKKFQSDLRTLMGMGLSNDAYKQLVDAGVEQGGAFADALVRGGYGGVQDLNNLVADINKTAKSLGLEASNRLYQAGVNAAKGLVDGLNSLSDKLDSAADKLGKRIASALRRALGIKSPSRKMYEAMGYVGDGISDGLDAQRAKVDSAVERLSSRIAVSPEVAAYAARQGTSPEVSGNTTFDLTVVTPTEDPKAVALETMNELTGRLL